MVKPSKLRSFNLENSGSRDFRISRDVHLVKNVTPLIFLRNLIFEACTCNRTLSVITKFSRPCRDTVGEKALKLKNLELCFFQTILVSQQLNSVKLSLLQLP